MGLLRVMGRRGDDQVTWELDAADAIAKAEAILEEALAKGGRAYERKDGKDVPITKFVPEAEEILIVPQMVGG